jgi:endonuclease/exonuclease/phosphatase family metal-dependent hydrolase
VDRQRDQSAQLRFLRQLFLATPAPAVLMADFNVTREHPIIREMMDKDGVIEATESVNGGGKIEMVLAKGLRAVNAGRLDEGASDHPIVWAELEVESGRGGRE